MFRQKLYTCGREKTKKYRSKLSYEFHYPKINFVLILYNLKVNILFWIALFVT